MSRVSMIPVCRIPRAIPSLSGGHLLPVNEERPEDFRVLRHHVLRLVGRPPRPPVFDLVLFGSPANGSPCSGILVPRVQHFRLPVRVRQ